MTAEEVKVIYRVRDVLRQLDTEDLPPSWDHTDTAKRIVEALREVKS